MIVQPIHYTAVLPAWLNLVDALGATTVVDADVWLVRAFGSGRLALHGVPDDDPQRGTAQVRLAVPDLDAAYDTLAAPVAGTGATLERREAGHGVELVVRAPDGVPVYLDREDPAPPARPERDDVAAAVAVEALWMTPDVAGSAALLTALGLTPRISSESGGWQDLTASDGGLVGVHGATTSSLSVTFEHPDLDAVSARLDARGIAFALIDESYGRSLQVPSPDAPDDPDVTVWVNEAIHDLYGYRRA
ncbi:conserved hypothetical protein [Beutenbergia cavernae DSM 12333]|uniref:VOC domain-containing protein n=1 Tax=Beutenbergia cavernae (strain ATCC BAA-8 / DSM 12333 / CCUG 43141 / JCM 11478 / NBRC 16432 / NCIMB 13614 / HKI 0122) TaxID=471853 RepID=C5BW29_BEUC1|nr:hypothetical protein [Beutenbergia cavernae]ACQ80630.1 conserved hypothetical protein [Beutenbergia cavernae DSM 12333]